MLARSDLLAEADRCSKEAYQAFPRIAAFAGTRGFALIRMGHTAHGMDLVRRSYEEGSDDIGRALNACCLAIGASTLGHEPAAHEYLENARKLDPSCLLLATAADELHANEEARAAV
jgi:hypothetical protein